MNRLISASIVSAAMLLLTVVSANAGGGSLLTLTKQCGDSQMSYSSRTLSQGDIVLGGGPPTGVYEITSSTSGTAWCYRYEVKKNNVLIYSGSFGPYCGANLSLEITAQQGDIITLGLAADIIVGGGTCTGGSGTIRFGVE